MSLAKPKTLVLSLIAPAGLFLSEELCDFDQQVRVAGEDVDLSDTPWAATVADLVVDRSCSSLVGLSFACSNEEHWHAMRHMSKRLDPNVVCLVDRFFLNGEVQQSPGASREHRFEIMWAKPGRGELESAQLLCGQWSWCYSQSGEWAEGRPIVAIAITDVDEILDDHELIFPKTVDLRQLDVAVS